MNVPGNVSKEQVKPGPGVAAIPSALVGKDQGMERSPATHGLHDGVERQGTMERRAGGAADNLARKQIRND